MNPAWLLVMLTAVPGQTAVAKDEPPTQQAARAKRERLLEIYTSDAAGYAIFRDSSRRERVELRREPVYVWTNPLRMGGQDGAVYVWTCRGGRGSRLLLFGSRQGAAKPGRRVSIALARGPRSRPLRGRRRRGGRPKLRASSSHRSQAALPAVPFAKALADGMLTHHFSASTKDPRGELGAASATAPLSL